MKTICLIVYNMILFQACEKTDSNNKVYDDFSIYLTKDTLVKSVLDLSKVVVDKSFIKYENIVSYDSTKHILELNYKTYNLFYSNGLDGRGFVAMLNNNVKVYCGVLWSPIHSNTNPNIVITLPMDNIANNYRLEIIENYHDSSINKGYNMINDKRIIDLLKKDKKLK